MGGLTGLGREGRDVPGIEGGSEAGEFLGDSRGEFGLTIFPLPFPRAKRFLARLKSVHFTLMSGFLRKSDILLALSSSVSDSSFGFSAILMIKR